MTDDWQDQLTPSVRERFWDKVATGSDDECWLWFASTIGSWADPRGSFSVVHGKTIESHRIAWVITNGRIPAGMYVLHKCDVGLCCNPKHLFLGTPLDNMLDKATKGRGYNYSQRKLTPEQIIELRSLYPQLSLRKLADKYNTTNQIIWRIVNRVTYQDIP